MHMGSCYQFEESGELNNCLDFDLFRFLIVF